MNEQPTSKDPKIICESPECGWRGLKSQALIVPDLFEVGGLISCPMCRELSLIAACEEDGCNEVATFGSPTPEGYRWTCDKHSPKI